MMNNYPVQKNQELTVDIIDLTHEGMGVAKIDHYPIFIENALPQEQMQIKIIKVGKKFAIGKILSIEKTSPDRVSVEDEKLVQTGIAPLSHLRYDKQLLFKKEQVENVLWKIAKMPEIKVLDTLGMEEPIHYRNKAQIPIQRIEGKLTTGFYRKNSHDLVPIDDFMIQDPAIDDALIKISEILQFYKVKAYNETNHEGFLRHIVIRRGHYSHEMMVILVTRKEKFFKGKEIAAKIHEVLPDVVSVVQNVNPEQTNVILGKEDNVLYGQSYITDQLLEKDFQISPQSFYQVNTQQAEVLYQKAFDLAELKETDTIIDAYAGIGTIGISAADKVSHVYGMELVDQAVQDANKNVALNGLENAVYLPGKAEKVLPQWQNEEIQANVIFVDPPRKGLDESFIQTACEMNPEKIVYISCNPATLARDLVVFAKEGYHTNEVQPVDMFPQTTHVECVVLMSRVEK